MPTLFLGNVATAMMLSDIKILSEQDRQMVVNTARRFMWMMSPGDAIILPCRGEAEYIHYIEKVCQYSMARCALFMYMR
jgi:hypothetical protein